MNSTTVGPGDSIIASTIEQKRRGVASTSVTVQRAGVFVACPACTIALPPLNGVEHSRATTVHCPTTLTQSLHIVKHQSFAAYLVTQRTPPASSSNAAAGSCVSLSLCGKSGNGLFILQCRSTAIPVLRVVSNTWPEQHPTAQRIQPASPVAGTDR